MCPEEAEEADEYVVLGGGQSFGLPALQSLDSQRFAGTPAHVRLDADAQHAKHVPLW